MNALSLLHFHSADVRMVMLNGVAWWVLNDICMVLEIANPRNVARRLKDWQKGVHTMDTLGGRQDLVVVNEAGIYKVVLGSNKPIAEDFERWLTTEVLPAIRKHGQYPPPPMPDIAALPAPEPIQPSLQSTPNDRLFEECRRVFGTDDVKMLTQPLSGIFSPHQMRALKLGGSVEKAIYKSDAMGAVAALFDLRYILTGVRTLTAQERVMRDQMRMLEPTQRAIAFDWLPGQISRLSIDRL
ncbi:Bro-N domain-containing protein [Sphingobium yanoikuyae]|uniref:BRO-N domain-containing protein n=1 Tax=Sphingobium yanoikuyae TaxID=13690 RepID=UPI002FDEA9D6